MDKWNSFYISLLRSQQNKVTAILKDLENLNNPAVLDEVKNKLLDESEKVDRLLVSKAHKKGFDI